MVVLTGKSVFGGVAFGKIRFYQRTEQQIKKCEVTDLLAELERFKCAKDKAHEQLKKLYDKALTEVGENDAMIFKIHRMILEDLDYYDSIENIILSQCANAEYAIKVTTDSFSQMFAAMEDSYMRERASDIRDVSERLINILTNSNQSTVSTNEPVIIAADDLVPSETVQLDREKVLGVITMHGSTNSHTAILAKTKNILAVTSVGEELKTEYDGMGAIIDGFEGKIYIEPDEATARNLLNKKKLDDEHKQLLLRQKGQENRTLDGQTVGIYANIGSLADIPSVIENDAGGIGLFRSEFLYLESKDYPSEEQQFEAYREAAAAMHGKPVIIRTLDIGADKQADYFKFSKEANPAMGYRAIRISLTRKDIFKTQIRSLLRASAYGDISMLFPMVISLDEIYEIKMLVGECKNELADEGKKFNPDIKLGAMIETPAAAIISDLIAKEVDFFSIGTNDLTQYSLAIDRQNPKLDKFYNPHHKAILRLLKIITDNAHKNGIKAYICGELGADTLLTEAFLAIGIDEISVSPSCVLALREKVRASDISKIRTKILNEILN